MIILSSLRMFINVKIFLCVLLFQGSKQLSRSGKNCFRSTKLVRALFEETSGSKAADIPAFGAGKRSRPSS